MLQHIGAPSKLLVNKGDEVRVGQLLAQSEGFVSANIHSSVSGKIAKIDRFYDSSGYKRNAIQIEVNGDEWIDTIDQSDTLIKECGLSQPEIVKKIQDAGIVGMGGATFPSHVKLAAPRGKKINCLIINGVECEPYLTADHALMLEKGEEILTGIRIIMEAMQVNKAIIGIEKNKPDAIHHLSGLAEQYEGIHILGLKVKYPQGAEKMLIRALLRREVPSGKLPMHVGVVVQNVGSVTTIGEVFETGLPLVERIVTVTGRGIRQPSNLLVPVGVKLRDLLDACGGMTDDAREIIFGGPMMGASQANLDVPICKGTTGVVVLTEAECKPKETYPCIRCGHCLESCPVFLNPQHLGSLALADRYEEMEEYHLADCMLSGCCNYVCPSNVPLPQLFSAAKATVQKLKAKK